MGDERENCGRQKNKEDLCSAKRKRESKEDKGGLLRQRLGELRWRVIQSPEDEAGQQCVLKRRFYYYSGIARPTVEETTVTGRIVSLLRSQETGAQHAKQGRWKHGGQDIGVRGDLSLWSLQEGKGKADEQG